MSRLQYDPHADYNSLSWDQHLSQGSQDGITCTANSASSRALASAITAANRNWDVSYDSAPAYESLSSNAPPHGDVSQYGHYNNSFNSTIPSPLYIPPFYPNQLQDSVAANSSYSHQAYTTQHGFHNGGYGNEGYNNAVSSGNMGIEVPSGFMYPNYRPSALVQSSSQADTSSVAESMSQLQANFRAFQQDYNNPSYYDPGQQGYYQHSTTPQDSQPAHKQLFSRHPPGHRRTPQTFSYKKEIKHVMKMTDEERDEELNLLHQRIRAIYQVKDKIDRDSGKLTKFTIFTKLPTELQLKIWKHAIPDPRVVAVQVYKVDGELRKANPGVCHTGFRCFSSPPSMLIACKASRDIILATYTTCINMDISPRKIRLDGAHDTLVLLGAMNLTMLQIHVDGFSNVTKLGMQGRNVFLFSKESANFIKREFKSLRELILLWTSRRIDFSQIVARTKDKVAIQEDAEMYIMQEADLLLKEPAWKKDYFISSSKESAQKGLIELKSAFLSNDDGSELF